MRLPTAPARHSRVHVVALWIVLALALASPADAASPAVTPGAATAGAVSPAAPGPVLSRPSGTAAPLLVRNRLVAVLRAEVYGYPPAERARAAVQRIGEALAQGGPGAVTIRVIPEGRLLEIDGDLAFALTPDDAFALGGETLDQVAARAARALERIAAEHRESKSPRALLVGIGLSVIATVVYVMLLRGLFLAHGRLARGLVRAFEAGLGLLRIPAAIAPGPTQMLVAARRVVAAIVWTVALAASYLWLAYVLERFGVTRPWGERLLAFLVEAVAAIPVAAIEAVPGLFVVMVVAAATLALTRLVAAFLGGVASERIRLAWLSPDAARPTARIATALLWVFALAMAYPYLPGAQTEAFKGLSVLLGVMVSLGASGVVGQAVSGLILMYSGAIRPGDYVRIGDTEGTVTKLGMFASRLQTGMGAEVLLPSVYVFSTMTTNYSRALEGPGFVLDTSVTIGYDAPWRQVHAMLLEAARRTPGILTDPRPYVIQTALADFYVEYRLVAYAGPGAPRTRAEALNQLHAHIQDVFNEYGVQIMSPHYMIDPAAPKVVPKAHWHASPAPGDGVSSG